MRTDIESHVIAGRNAAGRDLPPGGPGLEEEIAITFMPIAADASRPVRNGWDRLRLAQALGAERRDEHVRRISEALARDRLRGLAPRSDRCRVLAIASGKGGVGKSNIAAGLAILLSAGGARVALVDADLGFGNLDVLLGVSPTLTLEDVFAGRKRLEEVLVEVAEGVRLAAGSPALAGMGLQGPGFTSELLGGVLRLREGHDFIILDCGSGLTPETQAFCGIADEVIVVTSPEPTALADAYGLIKALAYGPDHARLSVLVNMASGRDEAKAASERIASVAGRFLGKTIYDAGYVLNDGHVPAAVRRRRPFVLTYPRCGASTSLRALAAKLRPETAGTEAASKRLLRRLGKMVGRVSPKAMFGGHGHK